MKVLPIVTVFAVGSIVAASSALGEDTALNEQASDVRATVMSESASSPATAESEDFEDIDSEQNSSQEPEAEENEVLDLADEREPAEHDVEAPFQPDVQVTELSTDSDDAIPIVEGSTGLPAADEYVERAGSSTEALDQELEAAAAGAAGRGEAHTPQALSTEESIFQASRDDREETQPQPRLIDTIDPSEPEPQDARSGSKNPETQSNSAPPPAAGRVLEGAQDAPEKTLAETGSQASALAGAGVSLCVAGLTLMAMRHRTIKRRSLPKHARGR